MEKFLLVNFTRFIENFTKRISESGDDEKHHKGVVMAGDQRRNKHHKRSECAKFKWQNQVIGEGKPVSLGQRLTVGFPGLVKEAV